MNVQPTRVDLSENISQIFLGRFGGEDYGERVYKT